MVLIIKENIYTVAEDLLAHLWELPVSPRGKHFMIFTSGVGISYYRACTDEILEDEVHLARLPPSLHFELIHLLL